MTQVRPRIWPEPARWRCSIISDSKSGYLCENILWEEEGGARWLAAVRGQSSVYSSHQFGSVTFNSGLCNVPLWLGIWHWVYLWGGAQQKPASAKCPYTDFSQTTCIHPKVHSTCMECEQFGLHVLTRKWNLDAQIHSAWEALENMCLFLVCFCSFWCFNTHKWKDFSQPTHLRPFET